MAQNKSQVSFEFVVVLFVVILVTAVFGVIAGDRLLELQFEQNTVRMQQVSIVVKNEIDIAHTVEPGYVRTFSLPYYLGNHNYSITIQNDFVIVSLKERKYALAVQPVDGVLKKGPNVIESFEGSVVLNG